MLSSNEVHALDAGLSTVFDGKAAALTYSSPFYVFAVSQCFPQGDRKTQIRWKNGSVGRERNRRCCSSFLVMIMAMVMVLLLWVCLFRRDLRPGVCAVLPGTITL